MNDALEIASISPSTSGEITPARSLPADVEVEMALLGTLLVNNSAFDRVADIIDADSFADTAHQKIFSAMQRLVEAGRQATPTTLRRQFENDETLSDLGGARYLAELAAGAANIIDAADYARLVHDLHIRRQLIEIGTDTVNEAYGADPDLDGEVLIKLLNSASSSWRKLEKWMPGFSLSAIPWRLRLKWQKVHFRARAN